MKVYEGYNKSINVKERNLELSKFNKFTNGDTKVNMKK